MASDFARFRVDQEMWGEYGELVGRRRRSADLRAYIEWRLDNPTTPLPGKRCGPGKRSLPLPDPTITPSTATSVLYYGDKMGT